MKQLLVPTDFSKQSEFALAFAVDIAKKSGGSITVLHVADLPVVADPMGTNLHAFLSPDTLKQMEARINEKLGEFIHTYNDHIAIETRFEWGNPFAGISKVISEVNADLVIIGSKGASGLKEIFIGSNAERIIRSSKTPVITIKQPTHIEDIKKIVFGTDLSDCPESLINQLKNLATFFGAELCVVRINTPNDFIPDSEVWQLLKEFKTTHLLTNASLHVYNDLNEDLGLIRFADSVNANLIALGTHGKRGLEHFISGSIAEDTVNHAKRPIWTCVINK